MVEWKLDEEYWLRGDGENAKILLSEYMFAKKNALLEFSHRRGSRVLTAYAKYLLEYLLSRHAFDSLEDKHSNQAKLLKEFKQTVTCSHP